MIHDQLLDYIVFGHKRWAEKAEFAFSATASAHMQPDGKIGVLAIPKAEGQKQ